MKHSITSPTPDASVARQESPPSFEEWFGESKVVDDAGKPLMVYHGTRSDINQVDINKAERLAGFWVTPDASLAATYAAEGVVNASSYREGANVMPLYARVEKPRRFFKRKEPMQNAWADYIDGDYDGFFEMTEDGWIYAITVKAAEQIKSAIGNVAVLDRSRFNLAAATKIKISCESLLVGTEAMFDDYGHGWFRHRCDDRAVDLEVRGDAYHIKLLEERADTSVFGKSLYDVATASFPREAGTAEMMSRLKRFIEAPIRELVSASQIVTGHVSQCLVPRTYPVGDTEVEKPVAASRNGRDQSFDML